LTAKGLRKQELLRLEGIKKSFGAVSVLRGIDLCIDRGEFLTILGASGCGKTTILKIIAGLEEADEGRIFLEGRDVSADEPNKRNVRMVFQNYALFPHMSVEANVGYSLRLKRAEKSEINKAVTEALDLVRLSGYEKRMPSELSGGQKQRIAVARALIGRPPILLLDEPLGALDLQLRRQMQIELKRLQEQLGITFIYITHDQEEALTMSDRIAVMRSGLFEQIGSAQDIYNSPATSYVARFVGNANVLHIDGKYLAIRAEHVEFIPKDNDGSLAAGLPGRIIARSFTGGQIRLTALLQSGEEINSCHPGMTSTLKEGMEVLVRWAPENAVPVEDTD